MKKLLLSISFLTINLSAYEDDFKPMRENIANFYYKFLDTSTSFLYDKSNLEYIKKHNKLRFYLNTSFDEDGKFSISPSIRASIRLPKISKKLYLSIDKESKITDNPNEIETPKTKESRSSRVGLKYYFQRDNDIAFFAKLGGRPTLSGNKIYIQGGYERVFRQNNHYFFSYIHHNYYFKDKINLTNLGVNYNQKLSKTFAFLQNNNLRLEDRQKSTINNSFILEQFVTNKVNYTYWINLYSIKEKSFKLNSISYNFKYHRMLKKWIFVDIIPSIVKNFNNRDDFDKYLYINFGFIF